MKGRSDNVLRVIAHFRFTKAILLILAALGAFHLLSPGVKSRVVGWADALPFTSQHAFAQNAIAKVTRLSPKRIEELAIVALLYAALFITEGTGLWMGKVWAEWLTVVATTSFIPFEAYEVLHKPAVISVGVLIANIAIVIYLIWRRTAGRRPT